MKITEFRLGEIPFLAIDRLLDFKVFDPDIGMRIPLFDDGYLPAESWLSEAGKKGRSQPEIATAIVYWYPSYIDVLYHMALTMGRERRENPVCGIITCNQWKPIGSGGSLKKLRIGWTDSRPET
jgi:hypothetical protein